MFHCAWNIELISPLFSLLNLCSQIKEELNWENTAEACVSLDNQWKKWRGPNSVFFPVLSALHKVENSKKDFSEYENRTQQLGNLKIKRKHW